jgi:hypothetical protein
MAAVCAGQSGCSSCSVRHWRCLIHFPPVFRQFSAGITRTDFLPSGKYPEFGGRRKAERNVSGFHVPAMSAHLAEGKRRSWLEHDEASRLAQVLCESAIGFQCFISGRLANSGLCLQCFGSITFGKCLAAILKDCRQVFQFDHPALAPALLPFLPVKFKAMPKQAILAMPRGRSTHIPIVILGTTQNHAVVFRIRCLPLPRLCHGKIPLPFHSTFLVHP